MIDNGNNDPKYLFVEPSSDAELSSLLEQIAISMQRIDEENLRLGHLCEQLVWFINRHRTGRRSICAALECVACGQGTKRIKLPPKFRDPETGQTWTGRGKLPLWLRDRNIEDFRIQELSQSERSGDE